MMVGLRAKTPIILSSPCLRVYKPATKNKHYAVLDLEDSVSIQDVGTLLESTAMASKTNTNTADVTWSCPWDGCSGPCRLFWLGVVGQRCTMGPGMLSHSVRLEGAIYTQMCLEYMLDLRRSLSWNGTNFDVQVNLSIPDHHSRPIPHCCSDCQPVASTSVVLQEPSKVASCLFSIYVYTTSLVLDRTNSFAIHAAGELRNMVYDGAFASGIVIDWMRAFVRNSYVSLEGLLDARARAKRELGWSI